jgi:hypothetical protein
LRLAPLLDYRQYRRLLEDGGVFRFTGGIESLTDDHTLWVRGDDLTIPVNLEKAKCWLLPKHEGAGIPEAPEKIRWNRVSTISEGVKVYIGGRITTQNNRLNFVSSKENPLIVIFYNCSDTELTDQIIRASRTRYEYWNSFTPISLVIGALSLLYIAASFLNRPAFRLTALSSLVAIFTPVLPLIPPGLLFTGIYRRMTWQARIFRAYWDLSRLPLSYLKQGEESSTLATGEKYGFIKIDSLPQDEPLPKDAQIPKDAPPPAADKPIPWLVPENFHETGKNPLYFFGVINKDENLPQRSKDPFVSYGILPAPPHLLARRYALKAYIMEAFAWLILILGIAINIAFIFLLILAVS